MFRKHAILKSRTVSKQFSISDFSFFLRFRFYINLTLVINLFYTISFHLVLLLDSNFTLIQFYVTNLILIINLFHTISFHLVLCKLLPLYLSTNFSYFTSFVFGMKFDFDSRSVLCYQLLCLSLIFSIKCIYV